MQTSGNAIRVRDVGLAGDKSRKVGKVQCQEVLNQVVLFSTMSPKPPSGGAPTNPQCWVDA